MDELISLAPPATSSKDIVSYFIMSHTRRSLNAILLLARNGFSEDADKIARSMYDGYAHLATCCIDPTEESADTYLSFHFVSRKSMFETLRKDVPLVEYLEQNVGFSKKDQWENVVRRADEWQDTHHRNWNNWQNLKNGVIAENIGMKSYYKTAYALQSHLVHVLPIVINKYVKEINGELKMIPSPTGRDVETSLASAIIMSIAVAETFHNHFHLNLEDDFKQIAKRIPIILNFADISEDT